MVDLERLSSRPSDRILTAHGYVCEKCGNWEAIFHSNSSLDELMRKLERMRPDDQNFVYCLAKAVKKAQEIQRRVERRWHVPILSPT